MVAAITIGIAAGFGAASLGVGTWAALAIGLGVGTLNLLTRPELDFPERETRTSTYRNASVASHKVVGTYPVGGMLAYVGAKDPELHLVYAVSGARMIGLAERVVAVKVADSWTDIHKPFGRFSDATLPYLPDVESSYYTHIEVYPYLNGDGTGSSVLQTATADFTRKWTAAHAGNGLSYIYVRLMKNGNPDNINVHPDLVTSYRVWRRPNTVRRRMAERLGIPRDQLINDRFYNIGIPQLTFLVKGTISDNPVKSLKWYEINRRNVGSTQINDTVAAEAYCDGLLTYPIPAGHNADYPESFKRYTCNGIIIDTDDPSEVEKSILWSMQGHLIESGGRFTILPGNDYPATKRLDREDLVKPKLLGFTPAIDQKYNSASVQLEFASHNRESWRTPVLKDTFAIARDGRELFTDLGTRTLCTTDPRAAERLVLIHLRRARATAKFAYDVTYGENLKNFLINPGDIIFLNDPEYGFNDLKVFVDSTVNNGDGTISLGLSEYNEEMYDPNNTIIPPLLPITPRPLVPAAGDLPQAPTIAAVRDTSRFDGQGNPVFRYQVSISSTLPADSRGYLVNTVDPTTREVVVPSPAANTRQPVIASAPGLGSYVTQVAFDTPEGVGDYAESTVLIDFSHWPVGRVDNIRILNSTTGTYRLFADYVLLDGNSDEQMDQLFAVREFEIRYRHPPNTCLLYTSPSPRD